MGRQTTDIIMKKLVSDHILSHKNVTGKTLRDLDVAGIPRIYVCNKADISGKKNKGQNHADRDSFCQVPENVHISVDRTEPGTIQRIYW